MTNTSITAPNTNEGDSVLKSLRSLMPSRALSYSEALQRAELQAHRLLTLHGLTGGPVPIEIVTELPRLRVVQTYDLPVSGSAHWDGGSWVLTVNAAEFDRRQRDLRDHRARPDLTEAQRILCGDQFLFDGPRLAA